MCFWVTPVTFSNWGILGKILGKPGRLVPSWGWGKVRIFIFSLICTQYAARREFVYAWIYIQSLLYYPISTSYPSEVSPLLYNIQHLFIVTLIVDTLSIAFFPYKMKLKETNLKIKQLIRGCHLPCPSTLTVMLWLDNSRPGWDFCRLRQVRDLAF